MFSLLGTGGIKPNVVTFGADQFSDLDASPEEIEALKQTFFNWFYFSINLGSAISYTGECILPIAAADSIAIAYVQQNISFTVGLAIPTGVMGLSILLFLFGFKWYRISPPSGSVIGRCVCDRYHLPTSARGAGILYAACSAPSEVKNSAEGFWERAKAYPKTDSGVPIYSEDEVDSIRSFMKILPIFGTFVVFW